MAKVAMIPTTRTVIAISSSMSPNPPSSRRTRFTLSCIGIAAALL
jgi:hypothetical protein